MKRRLIFIIVPALALACTSKSDITTEEINFPNPQCIMKIGSRVALMELINQGAGEIKTKSTEGGGLLDPFNPEEIEDDPILQVDCREAIEAMIEDNLSLEVLEEASVYEIAGYDTLVPNLAFAGLLNRRGEIQVADTIYKISPKGTYYFHESLLETFESQYEYLESLPNPEEDQEDELGLDAGYEETDLEEEESGEPESEDYAESEAAVVGEELLPGIYRYNTFNNLSYIPIDPESSQSSSFGYDVSNSCNIVNYNWGDAKKYSINAKTLLGKLFQSFFGSNKRHNAYLDNNSRLHAGLYSYNYVVYSESGISAQYQCKRKSWWMKTKAEELFIGWKNIILKTPYFGSIPSPLKNKMIQPKIIAKDVNQVVPIIKERGKTAYISDLNLSTQQLKSLVNLFPNQLSSYISQRAGGGNLTGTRCYHIFTEKGVFTIITAGGKFQNNKDKLVKLFHKSWSVSTSEVSPYVVPDLSDIWNTLKKTFKNRTKTEIFAGEAAAACYDHGVTKGMIFEKK